MIHFGTAGASDSFALQGYKHTYQAPNYLRAMGLDAFEYSSGRGVNIHEDSARKIGEQAILSDVALSIHAPYFINLAQEDPEKLQNSMRWLKESAQAIAWMGGQRVIFHPGAPMGGDRRAAMLRACHALEEAVDITKPFGAILCPETMGKKNQLGNVQEIIELCSIDPSLLPTIDFAHLHALGQGCIQNIDDYRIIVDPLLEALGETRMKHFHAHFSHIEYTSAGEKRHHNFSDEGYGPDFSPLARLLLEYHLEPTIICESAGHQAEDAQTMKQLYQSFLPNKR